MRIRAPRRPWYRNYLPGWWAFNPGSGGGAATVQTDGVTIQGDGSAGNKIALLDAITDGVTLQGAGISSSKLALKAVQTNASLSGAGTAGSHLSVNGAPITGWCTSGAYTDQSTLTANKLWLVGFFLAVPLTFSKIAVNINTADGTNNSDVGLYNVAGTLLANAGAQHMGSTGFQTFSAVQGAQTIPAGVIFLAATSAGSTLQLKQADDEPCLYVNTAFGSSAGGALPASITPPSLAASRTPFSMWLM